MKLELFYHITIWRNWKLYSPNQPRCYIREPSPAFDYKSYLWGICWHDTAFLLSYNCPYEIENLPWQIRCLLYNSCILSRDFV